jgi:cytochrome d ubiquinol oxidase subunit II
MIETWYAIAALFLAAYAVLDGFDLGAGAVHLLVARTDDERRQVLRAIGPFWDGNEVFLLAAGGVLFVAFPEALASGLSGFYLAIHLVLWTLVLRGIAIEFRSHIDDPLWHAAWDAIFCVASSLLAILFGAALANLIRGVPLDAEGWFALTLFTHFRTEEPVGILDWYTVLVGVFGLVTFAAHGAVFLTWKTEGEVHDRSRRLGLALYGAATLLWPLITWATLVASPASFATFHERPLAWLGAFAAVAGLATAGWGLRAARPLAAFLGSCAFIAGILGATAAMNFPILLRASGDATRSLSAYSVAAAPTALSTALGWFSVGLPLVIVYFTTVFRAHRGPVGVAKTESPFRDPKTSVSRSV